ncbi:MAG TPA: DUF4920 domain-containing protein [Steroidobacteraceae bacterium]|jgi:hypothetical protein
MRFAVGAITFLLSTLAVAEHYGAPIKGGTPVSLETAIRQLDRETRADVLIEAQVEAVCVVKGCWMALKSPTGDVRVTFKDYGFFVPGNIIGKTVRVEGTLERVAMTLEETKHFVKDAGGDPSTVTQPRTEYRIVAIGVEVVGS